MKEFLDVISKANAKELITSLASGSIHFSEFRNFILQESGNYIPRNLYRRLAEFEELGLITVKEMRVRKDHKTYHPEPAILEYADYLDILRSMNNFIEGGKTTVYKFRGTNSLKLELILPDNIRNDFKDDQNLDTKLYYADDFILVKINKIKWQLDE